MLTVSITEDSLEYFDDMQSLADCIEIRVDTLKTWEILPRLIARSHLPLILTLRTTKEGGRFSGNYEMALEKLMRLRPAYIDIEWRADPLFVQRICHEYPQQKVICSYHDFEKSDFEKIRQCFMPFKADIYKVATMANSALDAIKMLQFIKSETAVAGMCMGEHGIITRILSPVFGSKLTIASVDETLSTAPGQLSIHKLLYRYRYRDLSSTSQIYALLGHPVAQSFSHYTHNRVFTARHIDAVYIKIDLLPEEFIPFWRLIQSMPFQGFSVTLPHKQQALSCAAVHTKAAEAIGAINTLTRKKGQWVGSNTDAPGALDAIEAVTSVKGKKVAILGTGGTARAIAYEAKKRGAHVTIIGRTLKKAEAIQADAARVLTDIGGPYDIIANTTPLGMAQDAQKMPLKRYQIHAQAVIFDAIFNPIKTRFLEEGEKAGATTISGIEMYLNQAALQFQLWFEGHLSAQEVRPILERAL